MKKNAITITAKSMLALTIATGALFVASSKRNGVSLVEANFPLSGKLTIDTGAHWGNGELSYKVAACFNDGTENEIWTNLVLVEAPNCFASLDYVCSETPTNVKFYRYSADLEETTWEANKKDTKTAVTFSIDIDDIFDNCSNFVLSTDDYGSFDLPEATHQIYTPGDPEDPDDSGYYSSDELVFETIALNKDHHAEYSLTVEMKEKDLIRLEDPFFANILESKVTFGDGMNPLDLTFWESGTDNRGFECNTTGTYTFAFDYYENHLVVTKEVEPTPVDPEDPTDPDEPSGGDTPSEEPSEKGEGGSTSLNISFKDILKIIAKTFRDAWNDLVAHIKRWFKLN